MAAPKDPNGLKHSLGRALDHQKRRRNGRKPDARAPKREKRSIIADGKARAEVNRLVPKEAQRHGDYRLTRFELVEVTEGGKRKKKETQAVRNLARTQIERWHSRGVFDERQMAAVLFYQEAYRKVFGQGPRLCAAYEPNIIRGAKGAIELWANSGLAAKEALRLLDQELFFRMPIEHFQVWQNVVIWDEPAGMAGGRLGFSHKPAEAAAKVIVVMLAGLIADIVIDSSRPIFGDLILDLDAPRRAGRRTA